MKTRPQNFLFWQKSSFCKHARLRPVTGKTSESCSRRFRTYSGALRIGAKKVDFFPRPVWPPLMVNLWRSCLCYYFDAFTRVKTILMYVLVSIPVYILVPPAEGSALTVDKSLGNAKEVNPGSSTAPLETTSAKTHSDSTEEKLQILNWGIVNLWEVILFLTSSGTWTWRRICH